MASKQFIDKLNEYNEWYSIPRANEDVPCPIIFEDLDCSNFPVYQYTTRFIGVKFKNCNFNNSYFSTCSFNNCSFDDCTFNYAVFQYNHIQKCKFSNCELVKCTIKYTDIWGDFDSDCIFSNTVFSLCCLSDTQIDADFTQVRFFKCHLACLHGHEKSLNKHIPIYCPAEGEFIAWKKVGVDKEETFIAKLLIPADAKRTSSYGPKCRCNKATVLEIMTMDGTPCSDDFVACSLWDKNFTYKKNDTLIIDNFDENRWNECSTGIHFFMTKAEAIEY